MPSDLSQIKDSSNKKSINKPAAKIFILSGGVGTSGEQLVRTVMAQFTAVDISIKIFPKVFTSSQVEKILNEALDLNAIVAHTFVNPDLRTTAIETSQRLGLVSIDLVGPLIEYLAERLNQVPMGKPGLYRQLYQSYFDRISAMDFGLDHDDGKNPDGWAEAEIVLLGASRVGKTPISLYLSVLGWKVANIPLVSGISPRNELLALNRRRLVGLTIAPGELVSYRKHRQRTLGLGGRHSDYIDPQKVFEEIEEVEIFLRRNQIPVIDVTGKPIETSADEIIRLVRRKLR